MSIRSNASTKVIASLGVVGAAAAVAGMGTFGTFTDSTTAVETTTGTGVLSIALNPASRYATIPAVTGGLLPGDSTSTPFDLKNDGTVDWASVTFKAWANASSALDTDPTTGLQLALESCSQPWAPTAPGSYSCGGRITDFYSGPILMEESLADAASLVAGGVDHVMATISFPADAGNELKGQASQISFTMTAVQRDGAAR